MPPAIAAIGAVVGAISGAIGAVVGVVSSLGIIGSLALSAGLSLAGKLLHGSTDPPAARGSVTQVTIDPNAPQPYVMGEGLVGGALRMDAAYGPTTDGVPNPFRWMVLVHSGGGQIEEITPQIDQADIDMGYYGVGPWLAVDTQRGDCPQSEALFPILHGGYSLIPGWDANSKLSGVAATGWNMRFDREGKVFSSGIPQLGAKGKWVKVYDPRKDSTFPGGSGLHRLGTESTYEWSENPALHAGTYAFGRYQNGKRTIGCGLPADAINWSVIAAWANVCDANGWRMFGVVYEPDDRWQNIKDIAAAGGGVPLIAGGVLSFHYQAPRLSIETITEADLCEDDMSVTAMRSYRDRINAISPKYRSPDSNWEMVNADLVSVASHIADDGEVKQVEWPFNFVKDVDQAAQLARYVIEDSREFQPIEITCLPTMRDLRPGDCVDLYLPLLGLDTPAVIIHREIDPATLKVKLTLVGETPGKHAFALGQTGTAPPAPALAMTGQERDDVLWGAARVPALTGNRVPFSQMEGGVAPWSLGALSAGITSYILSNGVHLGLDHIKFTGTASASGKTASIKSAAFPVTAQEYLAVSSGVETIGPCAGDLTIWWFDSAGAAISRTDLPHVPPLSPYNTPCQQIVQAPTGAVSAWLEYYLTSNGAGSFSGSMERPSVTAATAGQTAFPAYSPGPNAFDGADITGQNTANNTNNVGSRTATDVSNTIAPGGGVAVNQVITSSITNASVNAVSNAYSSGAASFPATTYTTIQSVSLTTSGGAGAVVALKAALNLSINDQAFLAVSLRITRDGTAIYDAAVPQTYTDVPAIPARVFFCSYLGTVSFSDTPGAGAHTYALQIYSSVATGSPTNPQVTNRYLEAIEIKK